MHFPRLVRGVLVLLVLPGVARGQQGPPEAPSAAKATKTAETRSGDINVSWLYGAYVPRDVPLRPLSDRQRLKLYLQQTYLTWGFYGKTAFFSLQDQAKNIPQEWGGGFAGFGKRFASRFGQFAVQNTLTSGGNFLLKYEPRYELCRCTGAWLRIRHAIVRNFVTYDRTDQHRRPQLALYAGAMGAGMISSTWRPDGNKAVVLGYQALGTQAGYGALGNLIAEFSPEIRKMLGRKPQN